LTSITIPEGVEVVSANLFAGCDYLLEIRFVEETWNLIMVHDVLFDKEMMHLIWCSEKGVGGKNPKHSQDY